MELASKFCAEYEWAENTIDIASNTHHYSHPAHSNHFPVAYRPVFRVFEGLGFFYRLADCEGRPDDGANQSLGETFQFMLSHGCLQHRGRRSTQSQSVKRQRHRRHHAGDRRLEIRWALGTEKFQIFHVVGSFLFR